jgi:membrane fusion protein (multidrug efflux system)
VPVAPAALAVRAEAAASNGDRATQSDEPIMKRALLLFLIVAGVGAGSYYLRRTSAVAESATPGTPGTRERRARGGGFGGGGFGGFGGFGGPRLPMSVELDSVKRADMSEQLTVVGNLIGEATVEAVPKVAGRLESVSVRLGDRVSRGQMLAKIEDRELQEQVRQAQASFEVSAATIRQREADLRFAQTNLDRSRNLYERQLIPKQTFDDAEARYQAATAQLDLAKAQHAQAQARLDELRINLANTVITSPVNGFIGKRTLDPGAWVTPNSELLSVVDISLVRLVANIVEKDLRRISAGQRASVEVDAFPDEKFGGRIARVSPVLDPATRTAQIEVEIDNPQFRLKPGMYARVIFTVEHHANTLVVPANALVDVQGQRGVFRPDGPAKDVAKFHPIEVGLMSDQLVEVASGLTEGDRVVSTGAAALREGDKIILPGQRQGGDRVGGDGPGRGRRDGEGGGRPIGRGPSS